MIKKYLRIIVCGLALQCNALPALANWDLAPATAGTVVHIFSINSGTTPAGTANCGGANVECPTTIPVNGAGSPLFVTGNAGLVTGTGGTFPVTGAVTANAGTNLNTSLLALEGGGNLATLASAISGSRVQSNLSQINGNTPATNNGVAGSGVQRVVIASDNTAFSVNATLQASSATAIGTVNPTTAANWGLGATSAAVPANAAYIGINTGGNLVGWTGAVTNAGTFAVQLTGATNNINNIGGTVSLPTGAATSALQTTINTTLGTPFQAGGSIGNTGFNALQGGVANAVGNPFFVSPGTGTTWTAVQSTAANLNMTCANCSGSGASGTDGGGFSAGASVFAPAGGFFQTTATNNALSNGQWGVWQMTTNRAGFVNLRNNAGAEIGVAAAPLQVSVANTAANGTAMLVTGTGGTFPITGTVTANAGTNLNTSALALESGGNLAQLVTDFGAPGATACTTDTASCNLNQQMQRNNQRLTTINTTLGTPFQAGASIGNTSFAATQATASNLKAQVDPLTIATWGLMSGTTPGTAPTNTQIIGGIYNSSAPGPTTGQTLPLQVDSSGNLKVVGTGILDTSAFSQPTTSGSGVLGLVNTSARSGLTNATMSYLSLDATAALRVAIVSGGGSGGTSSNFGSTFPTPGTAIGLSDGTNMVAWRSSNYGTSPGAVTVAGVNAFVTNTVASNTAQVNGVTTLTGTGAVGTGAQRVAVGTDTATIAGSAPGTAGTASTNVVSVQGIASMTPILANPGTIATWGLVAQGGATAPTNALVGGQVYNTSAPTPTNGQALALQSDASGNLKVIGQGLAQSAGTSGQAGSLVFGAVTTGSPTYVTGNSNPLSLDTSGSLRVAIISGGGSGGTSSSFGSAFPATGTAIGASDGTNMLGIRASNYGTSPGAVTALATNAFVTNAVTVAQATASSLNATVVGTGTFAVQSAPTTATAWGIIADKGTFTASTSPGVLMAGQFTAGGATACATAQACAVGMTVSRGLFTDLSTINAVTVLTGTGAVGTGSQRVAVGTDTATIAGSAPGTAGTASTNVVSVQGIASMTPVLTNPGTAANWGVGATGSAPVANAVYMGANGSGATGGQTRGMISCDQHAFVDNTTQLQTIVAGVSGRKTYVCGYLIATGGTATNIGLTSGTGTNCVTTSVAMTPVMQLVANDRVGFSSPFWTGLITLANADNLCVSKNAANSGQIEIWYAII